LTSVHDIYFGQILSSINRFFPLNTGDLRYFIKNGLMPESLQFGKQSLTKDVRCMSVRVTTFLLHRLTELPNKMA